MRGRSDHDPTMIRDRSRQSATRGATEVTFRVPDEPFVLKTQHFAVHQVLRLPRKVTLDLHQVLRMSRKVTLELHQVLRLSRKVTLEDQVAGAVLGEDQVSLFVAGAVRGEDQVSLFVAGAVLGEDQVSLFVAGAVLGEIWKDNRSAKCCIFQYKMCVLSAKSNLGCAAGCGLTGSCSDHSRIMVGSFSDRPRIGNDVSAVFSKFLSDFGRSFCVTGAHRSTSPKSELRSTSSPKSPNSDRPVHPKVQTQIDLHRSTSIFTVPKSSSSDRPVHPNVQTQIDLHRSRSI